MGRRKGRKVVRVWETAKTEGKESKWERENVGKVKGRSVCVAGKREEGENDVGMRRERLKARGRE